MYQQTTATSKVFDLRKRIRGISGGTSASKTISILLWIIDRAQTPGEKEVISIVSETMPHLKRGAIRDFLNIMMEHGYFDDKRWNKTDMIYTFETGKIVEFFSADQPGRVRGPRRDILFANEANNISMEVFTQLEIRTKKVVWLDWNPVAEFWFYTDIVGKRDDVDFITLTYKDNEALDPAIVKTIEARRSNTQWWRVYGEGQLGEAEGRIYTNWTVDLEEIPPDARLVRYGLDFGYSNDPTAIVGIYKWNDSYILDEVCYMKGLFNSDIAGVLSGVEQALVIGDSAEPKSIDDLAMNHKIKVVGASKGPGSRLQGIQYVQDQKIFVTKRSINIIKEYRNYLWQTNPDGKIINEPQEFMDHTMDAIRYGLDSFVKRGNFTHSNDTGGVPGYLTNLGWDSCNHIVLLTTLDLIWTNTKKKDQPISEATSRCTHSIKLKGMNTDNAVKINGRKTTNSTEIPFSITV